MSKKKACKKCKVFTEISPCPVCGANDLTTNWQGRIGFIKVKGSMIAHKMGVEKDAEYAIKVR